MELQFLNDYLVLIVLGTCLSVGYIIKESIPSIDNKYIPLIMGVLGVLINIWVNMDFTPEILLAGLFSGLSSTGLHELYRNLIGGDK